MKKIAILALSLLILIGVFSCEKENSKLQNDAIFLKKIEGLATIPSNVKLSDKIKNIILSELDGKERGLFFIEYTKDDISYLEKYGKTIEEGHLELLDKLNINPNLPRQEVIDKIKLQEKNQTHRSSSNNTGYTYVPYYYQFDPNENPNRYYWCGHTCLKAVGSKHGKNRTLQQIHQAFWANDPLYRADRNNDGQYASSVADLKYAARGSNFPNYDYPNSSFDDLIDLAHFYQRAMDGVNYHRPMIMPSFHASNYGHFYTIVGYITRYKSNGSIDYNNSLLLLRDVLDSSGGYLYDMTATVETFFNNRNKDRVLFVRP
ncbi:hypothetical protein [Aureispira sp. CCB-QB1]|uniref:hypothetical protein n=1 Tax=Aureispira sp. CCB-QB1 TaxID=1313421 RepID=UPI0006974D76|nr:hypothetical protein [Aureispira sp. CCB-QB1]